MFFPGEPEPGGPDHPARPHADREGDAPVIDRTYKLSEAPEAIAYLEAGLTLAAKWWS